MHITAVLGGTRSGKSRYAETRAEESNLPVWYLATARPVGDVEFLQRIAAHRSRRPAHWETREVGWDLPEAVRPSPEPSCWLLDSLTLWVSGVMEEGRQVADLVDMLEGFLNLAAGRGGRLVVVSDEVGLGGVAMSPVGREFADVLGLLNQVLTARCDEAIWVVAGLPWVLKGGG